MTYFEYKATYKELVKEYPDITGLYREEPENTILCTIEHYTKRGGRWVLSERIEKMIDFIFYSNTVDPRASRFMRGLGGFEKTTKAYTRAGLVPIECTSISPDRTEKTVRKFKF